MEKGVATPSATKATSTVMAMIRRTISAHGATFLQ